MDLSTTYLGKKLRTPLVVSPSPLSRELDNIKAMEDAGASAVVLYSLFEEQLVHDRKELFKNMEQGTDSFAESLTYYPPQDESNFQLGAEEYLKHIQNAKKAVKIPIFASLNGFTRGGWVSHAKKMEQAGADGIELNIYFVASDPSMSSVEVENTYLDILKDVKAEVKIPVAVKLSPYFTNMSIMASLLSQAGADSLVMFNRFYQPDIDLEELTVVPHILLSTPADMRLPLRWIALLYGKIKCDLAATSGIYDSESVLKLLMAGANVTMLCSALLYGGLGKIKEIENGMVKWMEENEYESVKQMKGSLSQIKTANPLAFERALYYRAITEYGQ